MNVVVEYSQGADVGYEVYTSVNLDHPDLAEFIGDALDLSRRYTTKPTVCLPTIHKTDGW